jgi:hypothetical protein
VLEIRPPLPPVPVRQAWLRRSSRGGEVRVSVLGKARVVVEHSKVDAPDFQFTENWVRGAHDAVGADADAAEVGDGLRTACGSAEKA